MKRYFEKNAIHLIRIIEFHSTLIKWQSIELVGKWPAIKHVYELAWLHSEDVNGVQEDDQ